MHENRPWSRNKAGLKRYLVHAPRRIGSQTGVRRTTFEERPCLGGQPEYSLKRCSPSRAAQCHRYNVRAAPGETIGVDGANPKRSAGNQGQNVWMTSFNSFDQKVLLRRQPPGTSSLQLP